MMISANQATLFWSMMPRVAPEGMVFRKPVSTPVQSRGRLFDMMRYVGRQTLAAKHPAPKRRAGARTQTRPDVD
jgi:hypothetical protein